MREVSIIGVGQIPVAEHWDKSLRMLGAEAVIAAMKDAGLQSVDALYVGNGYGGSVSSQTHVATMVADYAGLSGVEAFNVEAGAASGGAALRTGYMAVASGLVDVALVLGVEKDPTVGARLGHHVGDKMKILHVFRLAIMINH